MKKLPVDLGELQLALEDCDGGLGLHTYWFDRQTGEVIFLTEDLEEQDELREEIEEDADDRFVQIEPIDSHDGFRIMQDFVETMRQPIEGTNSAALRPEEQAIFTKRLAPSLLADTGRT